MSVEPKRKLPQTAPPSIDPRPKSGTRPKVSGILRLRPIRPGMMFDEVLIFPNGATLIAIEGEPLLRYPTFQAFLEAHGLDTHELVSDE
jgi:hypothetical protein